MKPEGVSIAIARGNAGAFLSTMLESEETVIGQEGRILVTEDGKDTAFVFWAMGFGQVKRGREVQQVGAVR
jgi:hypothetical protein